MSWTICDECERETPVLIGGRCEDCYVAHSEKHPPPPPRDHLAEIASLEERLAAAEERARRSEEIGARVVLDAIADTGFFGIAGEYGSHEKRDAFIRRVLGAKREG
jgi:hypothetical protein